VEEHNLACRAGIARYQTPILIKDQEGHPHSVQGLLAASG
jgi:hypothetical protein